MHCSWASRLCRAPLLADTHLTFSASSRCTACRQYQPHVTRRKASFTSITRNLKFGNQAGAVSAHGKENLICIWGPGLTSARAGSSGMWSDPAQKRLPVSLGSSPSKKQVGPGWGQPVKASPFEKRKFFEQFNPPQHTEEGETGERHCL